jgi:hypothetical protein
MPRCPSPNPGGHLIQLSPPAGAGDGGPATAAQAGRASG